MAGDQSQVYELTKEQGRMKEEAEFGVDERFIHAMFMKNVIGPALHLVIQSL